MYKLSLFQTVTFISASFLPLLLWVYPRYAVHFSGIDGQWAVLLVCVYGMIIGVLHGWLNQRFPKLTGVQMVTNVYGKWIGKVVALSFFPGYVLFMAISVYSFTLTMREILPTTPRLAIAMALTFTAFTGALYGMETIARAACVIIPSLIVATLATCVAIDLRGNWANVYLHPVHIGIAAGAAVQILPLFFGLNIFLMLSPFYDHRKRNSIWIALISVGLGSIIILIMYLTTVLMVGFEGARLLVHPFDFVVQLVEVRGFLFQRFGIVLIFMTTLFEAVFLSCHLWAMAELLRQSFGWKEKSELFILPSVAVITLVVFQIVPNQQSADNLVHQILVPLSVFYLVVEPAVKLVISYIRPSLRSSKSH